MEEKKFQEIDAARKLLELPEKATMETIKSNYRKLLAKWHPDKCDGNEEECAEKSRAIIAAYQKINDYCHKYQYSFTQEEVEKQYSDENWWYDRFGDDPLWGKATKSK